MPDYLSRYVSRLRPKQRERRASPAGYRSLRPRSQGSSSKLLPDPDPDTTAHHMQSRPVTWHGLA